MNVALPGHTRQVVVLERDASTLQRPHEIVNLFGDEGYGRCLVGAGVL